MHVHVPAANPFYSTRSAWIAFCISFFSHFFVHFPPFFSFFFASSSSFSLVLFSLSLSLSLFAVSFRSSKRVSSIRKSILTPERNISTRWTTPSPYVSVFSFVFFFFSSTLSISPVVRQISFLFHSDASKIYRLAGMKLRGRGVEFIRIAARLSTSRRPRDSTSSRVPAFRCVVESSSTKCFALFDNNLGNCDILENCTNVQFNRLFERNIIG